ncbi:unnamed protein product [marine sediment metagenome]|uniref:Metallo-beta-lactamase domain-containing protein n=1 Tax=marine sediment metagenome TaxID=412755 RepID=X1DUM4_9ZZZZ
MKNSAVRLTFLGGVNEVGGNKVLLEDFNYGVKIFLDFGINIKDFNKNFERYEEPSSVKDLIKLRLLPNAEHLSIENLYTNYEASKSQEYNDLETNVDGILITHPHRDHFYGLSFINRNIPVYTGVFTQKIISAYYNCSKVSISNNYGGLEWKLFRTGDVLNIKGLKIIPVHVDHSIPAAYGFVIKTSNGIVVYTGDFRMHGPLSAMTQDFLHEITNKGLDKIDVLICEGTHIHRGAIESENNVEKI